MTEQEEKQIEALNRIADGLFAVANAISGRTAAGQQVASIGPDTFVRGHFKVTGAGTLEEELPPEETKP